MLVRCMGAKQQQLVAKKVLTNQSFILSLGHNQQENTVANGKIKD